MQVDRLLLIQHGLIRSSGHWLQETQQWRIGARELGLEWLCLAHRDFDPVLAQQNEIKPAFAFRPYDTIDTPPLIKDMASFIELSDVMKFTLHQNIPNVSNRDLLLMAFTASTEIFGVAKWLATIHPNNRPRIAFMFHQVELGWDIDPYKLTVNADFSRWEYAARSITHQLPPSHVRFFAAGHALVNVLSHILKLPVQEMPLVATPIAQLPTSYAERPYDIGVLGGAREEQGSQLWADIFTELLKRRPTLSALIQAKTLQDERQLREALQPYSAQAKIDIISGPLQGDEYRHKLASIRLLLAAYMPRRYCLRDSGVFTEAVSAGIPVAVSSYTLMEKAIRAEQVAGASFIYGDTADTVRAISYVLDNIEMFSERALALAEPNTQKHLASNVLTQMLSSFQG